MGANGILGRTFGGRFSIVELLGEGAMGAVYRGVQLCGPDVAVKVMWPRLAHERSILGRFENEAIAATWIDHPNALRIMEHGVEDGLAYLVMELLEGRELYAVLRRAGPLSEARAARLAAQICDALQAAHDVGIVHRDLKPENVMVLGTEDGDGGERIKLLDFGIARRLDGADDDAAEDELAREGSVVGTPAYMSPEQCCGLPVDGRSDVYACGVVLYQLVTGRPPFDDEDAATAMLRQLHELPRAPSALVPGTDPAFESVILKALAKVPGDRHQSARELRGELALILPGLSAVPRPRAARDASAVTVSTGATRAATVPARKAAAPRLDVVPFLVGCVALGTGVGMLLHWLPGAILP